MANLDALYDTCGFGVLDRTLIEVKGADRTTFLHNLCTNNIQARSPGQGCEAFFTNVQGRTLCLALLWVREDCIVISTDAGLSELLLKHLDKYIIAEDVQLHDTTKTTQTLVVAGPQAATILNGQGLEMLQHTPCVGLPHDRVARVPFSASSFFLMGPAKQSDQRKQFLFDAGAVEVGTEALEVARIEAAYPSSGRDLTPDNFPQEIARDERAISFTKGCYLGQETVARIDALGHVNKYLVTLQFEAETMPPPGTSLYCDDQKVGQLTSVCWSPAKQGFLGLGFVRREIIEKSPSLSCEFGTAQIVARA